MKILILHLTAIGDIIHNLPCLYLLRKYFPNSYIGWAVCKEPYPLLKNHKLLDRVFLLQNFPKSICYDYHIIREMADIDWDIIIDYHFYFKTLILRSFLKGKIYTFSYSDVLRFEEYLSYFFSNKNSDCSKLINVTSKYLKLTEFVINENSEFKNISFTNINPNEFNLFCDNSDVVIDYFEKNKINNYIVLCPNSSEKVRIWKLSYWIDLIINLLDKNKYKILLLGLDFTQIGIEIKNKIIENKLNNNNLYILPKFNLNQVSIVLKKCQYLIAHDSCILHMGNFLGIKTIGIFGPTCGIWNCSYYKNCKILQGKTKLVRYKNHWDYDCIHQIKYYDVLKNIDN